MDTHPPLSTGPTAPIALFDSGVGGLSVLRHVRQRLPRERLLYVADTAYMPYGEKSTALIRARVLWLAQRLLAMEAKLLVLACNTATAAAVRELREALPTLPVVGMEPGLKPAIDVSRSRRVGIIATEGTLRSEKFRLLLARYGAGAEVLTRACPGLVEQVEQGALSDGASEVLLRRYLAPLQQAGVDTLVLGCTHYPFLIPLIRRIVGEEMAVIDTGEAVARQVQSQLQQHGIASLAEGVGALRFYTTADPEPQQALFRRLWGEPLTLERLPP